MKDHRKLGYALIKSLFGADDYMGEHEEKTITQRLKEQLGPPDPRVAERMRWEGLEDLADCISPKCLGTNEQKNHMMLCLSQGIRALAKEQRQRQIHREK